MSLEQFTKIIPILVVRQELAVQWLGMHVSSSLGSSLVVVAHQEVVHISMGTERSSNNSSHCQ